LLPSAPTFPPDDLPPEDFPLPPAITDEVYEDKEYFVMMSRIGKSILMGCGEMPVC
jgi:hypothetical protein